MDILVILALSVFLQIVAAVFSIRLIALTGFRSAWLLIAVAVSIMAFGRIVHLFNLLSGDPVNPQWQIEPLALATSLLLAIGIANIGQVFRDLKRSATAVRRSERKYHDLFENANDAIFLVDPELNYIDVNRKAVEMFGYSKEEFTRMKITDVIPPQQLAKSKQEFARLHQEGSYEHFEGRQRTKDGRWLDVEVSSSAIYEDGKIVGSRDIVRDITERKNLEDNLRQAQKMEAVGTLAGGIAHDFNNILFSILGYAQLSMKDVPKNSTLYENLAEIVTAGKRASKLIKQILTFSRRTEQERKPLELQPVIKEAAKMLRETLPATIEIRLEIEPHGWPVMADVVQIHQVIMNLCTNAYHAMREKGGVLTIGLVAVEVESQLAGRCRIQPGQYVRLQIKDTGHGIKETDLPHIFEPYFTTKELGEGTGLGLAIVHGIITSHNGGILVDSHLGKGTVFELYLPALPPSEQSERTETAEERLAPVRGRILLVDDEKALVRLGQRVLEQAGCQVRAFTDSREALAAFEGEPESFDGVITDQTMPHLTGTDLARKILARRPELPIILVTGYSETINEQQARELGISEFILKPLTMQELTLAVNRMLR